MRDRKLEIQLHGGFFCRWSDGERVDIRGVKHRALIAMLATAAGGTHTRAWVQESLWQLSGEDLGRASLRRALSDIRKIFGPAFEDVFITTHLDVRIDLEKIELIGSPSDGVFLDGINIPEPGFREWLSEKRHVQVRETSVSRFFDMRQGAAPRLAILPFLSRHRTEDEAHLADLLAMEVSRSMSRSPMIDVISHLSSRRMNTRAMDLCEISDVLGFDYVVYGSVRLENGRFRVDADLADGNSGRIVWSEDFDGRMEDLLAGQSDVVGALSSRIGHGIVRASVELAQSRPTSDIASHALLMSSITLMHGHQAQEFIKAKQQLDELIERLPNNAGLHAWKAKWHVLAAHQGFPNRDAIHKRAVELSRTALDIDPKCSFSLAVDGMVHSNGAMAGERVEAQFEKSLEIDPNNALGWLLYSRLHMFRGDGANAVKYAERACALSPYDPHQYFYDLLRACAESVNGNYAGALDLANKSLKANPRHTSTHRTKTISLAMLGRDDEAQMAASELLKWEPGLTIKGYLNNHPAGGDRSMPQQWAEALRRAGVPNA